MTQGEKKGHLSFSGLNTFEACQRNGYENYMQRVPESDARALLVGKLFHKCIEVGCDDDQIQEYIQNSKQKSSFFQKKKKDTLFEDFNKAIEAANYFFSRGIYKKLNKLHSSVQQEVDFKYFELQEYSLSGDVAGVPIHGIIDFVEITPKKIIIHDWKYIKDYKRTYNETAGMYEEWYEKYIVQQMLYAYLFLKENPGKEKKVVCEIVGITKQDTPAIKQITFEFESLSDLVSTAKWQIFEARLKYAWKVLNETTDKTSRDLEHCGVCPTCRKAGVVLTEFIEVE